MQTKWNLTQHSVPRGAANTSGGDRNSAWVGARWKKEKHVVRDPGARAGWGKQRLALPRADLHTHKVKHVCVFVRRCLR